MKKKNQPDAPKMKNGLFQIIRMADSSEWNTEGILICINGGR